MDPLLVAPLRESPEILLLTLNRPHMRNAVTPAMIRGICRALEAASIDPSVRAVVLTGSDEGRAFSAGMDIAMAVGEGGGGEEEKNGGWGEDTGQGDGLSEGGGNDDDDYRDLGGFCTLAALRCSKPIIAAINGHAVGWGLAFTLAADMRVVSSEARVGFPMAARGLVNESCSSYLLPRLVGSGVAKELVMTGRVMTAADMARLAPGLFNHVVDGAEQVLPRAITLAREVVKSSSPLSVAMCKYLLDEAWASESPERAMLNESRCLRWVMREKSDDLAEGFASFLQKRPPQWKTDSFADLPTFLPFGPRIDVRPRSQRMRAITNSRSKL